jgi:trigger factor
VHDLNHRLQEQQIGVAQFLAATGRTEEDFLEELRGEARTSVKSDLGLRALAEAEDLEVSEDEMDAELHAMAERLNVAPAEVRDRLTRAGRMAAVRSEQRKAKALSWLLDHVVVVDEDGAPVSRDDLQAVLGGTDEGAGAEGPEEDEASAEGGDAHDGAEQVVAGSGTATSNVEAEA